MVGSRADRLLRDPHVVELTHSTPAPTIEHALYPVESEQKLALLERLIGREEFRSAIVFTRTKHRAKRLAKQLAGSGHRAVALQGNMSQNARDRAMNGFRKREFDILVATDIAARGIDVEKISHVVNFDMPNTPDAYTHRIGRTGRAEREGKAYTLVTPEDRTMVREVERRIGSTIPRLRIEGCESLPVPSCEPVSDASRNRPRSAAPRGPGMRQRSATGESAGSGGARRRSRRRGVRRAS